MCVCADNPTSVLCNVSLALYLLIIFQLPNHVYYAQFVNLNEASLRQTIASVLLYMLFELLSLVAVHIEVQRLLHISPLRQLAFVLTRQAVHVQSALVMWTVYATQASLDHFGRWPSIAGDAPLRCSHSRETRLIGAGNDYSFQFAWLSKAQENDCPR